TRIEGKLKGEVRSSDLLVVGPQAVVQATVRADKLVVLGEGRGEGLGASRVEICPGGRLFGDVETQSLVLREGAAFERRARMRGPAPRPDGRLSAVRRATRRRSSSRVVAPRAGRARRAAASARARRRRRRRWR